MTQNLEFQRGSTLIEVMVAVLVLSLGLLGALKLQTEGVRQNADSRYTVLASTYAHDALDAISYDRTNQKSSWMMSSGSMANGLTGRPQVWLTNLQRDLPDGKADVGCTGNKCTIQITWVPPGRAMVTAKYEMYN